MRRFLFPILLLAVVGSWLAPRAASAAGPSFPKPTFNVYDEKIDRNALISETLGKARASGRRALLVFGSNDCGPCRRICGMLHDRGPVEQLLAARYVVAHVTVNGVRDRAMEARFGNVKELGIPWLVVVGEDGAVLTIQSTRTLAKGNGFDGRQLLAFLREWAGS